MPEAAIARMAAVGHRLCIKQCRDLHQYHAKSPLHPVEGPVCGFVCTSDHISSLASDGHEVGARAVFKGHKILLKMFNPSSAQEFCSVGGDYCLLLWDARMESSPAIKIWRMTHLLPGDEEDVLAELEKHRAHIPACPASSSRKH